MWSSWPPSSTIWILRRVSSSLLWRILAISPLNLITDTLLLRCSVCRRCSARQWNRHVLGWTAGEASLGMVVRVRRRLQPAKRTGGVSGAWLRCPFSDDHRVDGTRRHSDVEVKFRLWRKRAVSRKLQKVSIQKKVVLSR